MKRERWAIFISGRGSNLRSLLLSPCREKISLVVSSQAKASGLKNSRRFGAPEILLEAPINWSELNQKLNSFKITHIFLLGFMKIVPQDFIEKWEGKIFNLHPSLLPSYPGLNSIRRAYEDQAEVGVTIHEVVEGVDLGPIELQRKVTFGYANNFSLSLGEVEKRVHLSEQRMCQFFLNKKKVPKEVA